MNMEGNSPAIENETESLERKKERFQINVRRMFNENMEASCLIRRIVEENRSSFEYPRN